MPPRRVSAADANESTRLGFRVVIGALVGLSYTLIDAYLDRQVGLAGSTPQSAIEVLHTVVDLVLPTLTGALLAFAVHLTGLRSRMAALEKARAENLEGQIRKIERDQAVWVVAASLLHELKNPLHALGLLLDEAVELAPNEDEERKLLLARARSQSEKISTQLALLRGVPHAQSPDLPSVDLTNIIRRTVDLHEQTGRKQGVEFFVGTENPRARANPEYLEVILDNLLDNALDALREQGRGGRIHLQVQPERERVLVSIADSGPGIDPAAAAHLFEPLWSSKAKGLGLGLATARALARAMGGDISHRREGGQTIFELSLQRQP